MKVMLVDDHALFREGMRYLLPRLEQDMEILEARSCEEAMQLARVNVDLDLVLLDLALPGTDGLAGLKALRECMPSTPVVVLSAYEERAKVMQALQQGAQGYIPKSSSSEVMLSALRLVLSGALYLPATVLDVAHRPTPYSLDPAFSRLTVRERDVLKLLAQGQSNKGIGNALGVAESTVRVHVSSILRKLEVRNRTEAAYAAVRLGLVQGVS